MDIIGFGTAGCNIAKNFEVYPQYKVHYLDVGLRGKNKYALQKSDTMEDAEKNAPKFPRLVKKIKEQVTFICAGSGITSGSILAFLEQIKHLKITLIYVIPDLDFLSGKAKQRESLTRGVLQQFARSGLFENIYLLDNTKMAEIFGGLAITEYHKKINHLISNSYHMLNYLKNTDSVMTSVSSPSEVNRIATLGVYDMDEQVEKYFYDIENTREKHFYFAFNESTLDENKDLLNNISKQIKNARQAESIVVSYDITATTYEKNFAYIEAYTNFVQGEKIVDNGPE